MATYYTALPHRFLSVTGTDATKLLQGQCSCDIEQLDTNNFSFGTLNTPKGRIYAIFKIAKTKDGYLLSLDASTLESTLTKLSKYAVFFDCIITETPYQSYGIQLDNLDTIPSQFQCVEFPQTSMTAITSNEHIVLRLPMAGLCYEAWINPESNSTLNTETPNEVRLGTWLANEALNGIPCLYESTQENFILQNLNLQDLNAVSFKKGCYTGQEIIARMKYLGKQKKKMLLLTSSAQCTSEAGASVFNEKFDKCGVLVRSHWAKETGSVALAVLDIKSLASPSPYYLFNDSEHAFSLTELTYNWLP
jgi:folate-binding protein YgfZ